MRIFKNTWFSRFAEREAIGDEALRAVVNQLEAGQIDADLGGGVYKQRVARSGAGKSGAYRVIVFFKSGERTFFMYGFAKSDRDTIDKQDLQDFKRSAKDRLSLTDAQLNNLVKTGNLREI